MRHLVTIICDDIRFETGNKVSLMGLYDEDIVLAQVPARLPKLCMYQRWDDTAGIGNIKIELAGSAVARAVAAKLEPDPATHNHSKPKVQIMVTFAPLDLVSEGELSFGTYFSESDRPEYTHTIRIRSGAHS